MRGFRRKNPTRKIDVWGTLTREFSNNEKFQAGTGAAAAEMPRICTSPATLGWDFFACKLTDGIPVRAYDFSQS